MKSLRWLWDLNIWTKGYAAQYFLWAKTEQNLIHAICLLIWCYCYFVMENYISNKLTDDPRNAWRSCSHMLKISDAHTNCHFQSPEDSAVSITNIVRHHETEYLASLEVSSSLLSHCFLFWITKERVLTFSVCRHHMWIYLTPLSR